jgi:NAD(P)-dependent dehydrogenase (short-subunit alcohol dehydrogenase family)
MITPPKKRNPLAPLRAPKPLPAARSRAALGLAASAAEGRFRLQVCEECGAVQYPPRELCVACLGALAWRDVEPSGTLIATTTTRISSELWFRERPPWPSGIVELACGPKLVAHLHPDCAVGDPVKLALKLDPAGRGAVYAAPDKAREDEAARRAFTADPRQRNALVVDGRASTAPALTRALKQAGAARIYVGLSERWRPAPLFEDCEIVALDVSDPKSPDDLAALMGDKIDILINNCDHFHPDAKDAASDRLAFEIHALGAMRLAAAFGPVMRARTDEAGRSSAAFVSIVSALALSGSREHGAYAASQAALRSINQSLRAQSRASGLRVVDVLTGPIDDDWRQAIRPPKVAPAALAAAIVAALRDGLEEVVVGDVAKEIHAKWAEDPRLFRQESP